jgi:hypothetical protein
MESVNSPLRPGSWNRYAYVLGDPVNAEMKSRIRAFVGSRTLAKRLGISVEDVLDVAAEETLYGTKGIVLSTNDYFGLHVDGPGDVPLREPDRRIQNYRQTARVRGDVLDDVRLLGFRECIRVDREPIHSRPF